MKTKLRQDLKNAMKEKDKLKVSMIQMLISELDNKQSEFQLLLNRAYATEDKNEIKKVSHIKFKEENGSKVVYLTNEQEIDTVKAYRKAINETTEQAKEINRQDIIKDNIVKLSILENYLPTFLTEQEILKIMLDNGAKKGDAIGKIIGQVMAKHRAEVDGALVNKVALANFKG